MEYVDLKIEKETSGILFKRKDEANEKWLSINKPTMQYIEALQKELSEEKTQLGQCEATLRDLQEEVEKMGDALEEIKSGRFDSTTMMSIAHNALNK